MSSINHQNGLDPKIIKVFQGINKNLTEEQIRLIVDYLNPKPIMLLGQIINLRYEENGNNLVEITIQDNYIGNIFVLSDNPDAESKYNTLKIINLKDFQLRLQEGFNYHFVVIISYKDNRIVSLEIIKQIQEPRVLFSSVGPPSGGPTCPYGPPHC
ncbi:hypothetical protein [Pleurocapsa sp. PCC 7319]|uniref:hypothetical protein n=1 Tax=Pleurocapsa sp. PCC 7319 TaxID=118161 RepID=UPI00034AC929|nr:hypothetical protein [Pleurocapsa sp. PCC 7319]